MRVSHTKLHFARTLYDMCERGRLEDVTVTSLCEAAGVTRPTFYNHFDDLDDAITFASFLPATLAKDASDFGQVMRETCEGCLAHKGFFSQLADVGRFSRQWSNGFGWLERAARRRADAEGLSEEEARRMLLDCQLADQCTGSLARWWWAGGMVVPVDEMVRRFVDLRTAMLGACAEMNAAAGWVPEMPS